MAKTRKTAAKSRSTKKRPKKVADCPKGGKKK